MPENRVVTCVYCGMAYPSGTPTHGSQISTLTEHIRVCEKHPMRAAETRITELRTALEGIVGAHSLEELLGIELAARSLPIPEADKVSALNAIAALKREYALAEPKPEEARDDD